MDMIMSNMLIYNLLNLGSRLNGPCSLILSISVVFYMFFRGLLNQNLGVGFD